MRTTFVNKLLEEAKHNKNIQLLTGDLGFGVLKEYMETYPDQFTNCGIAEQNMLTVAGGMASMGKTVIAYSIGNFPTARALEQIRNDICYYNHDVKIICIGGGYTYGSLGMSHHATEDIAYMRALPNMHIFTPSDKTEAIACTNEMFKLKAPCYLRLERDAEREFHKVVDDVYSPQLVVNSNSKRAIFTYGTIIEELFDTAKEKGIDLYSCPVLKPINVEKYEQIACKYEEIISVEEHSIIGGLGDLLASVIATSKYKNKPILRKIGINDTFLSAVGKQPYLRSAAGIDRKSVEQKIFDK